MTDSLGHRFARAVAAKDSDALRGLLTDTVDFKAMTPGRLWEGSAPDDVITALGHWFGPDDRIDELLQSFEGDAVADTASFGYRVRVTNGDGPHLLEQQGYYRATDGRIGYLRLMCSGYRPTDGASEETEDASAIDRVLALARAGLDRVAPGDLEREVAEGALVVDTRPVEQRDRDGEMTGAIVVDRNVLEWRLDPSSPWRLPEADALAHNGGRVVLVCHEGYSSSLAAASLRSLGVARATDLDGGYQAWARLRLS